MKSLFSRFKNNAGGSGSGPSDSRPSSSRANSSASITNKENLNSIHTKNVDVKDRKSLNPSLKRIISKSHLPEKSTSPAPAHSPHLTGVRSLTPIANQHQIQRHSTSSPNLAYNDTRPHSVSGPISTQNGHLSPVVGWEDAPSTLRNRTVSASGDAQNERGGKKVTFRSPVPTPTTSVVLDEAVKVEDIRGRRVSTGNLNADRMTSPSSSASPSKRASTSALKVPTTSAEGTRPGTSQSTHSVRPRPTSRQTSPFLPSLAIRPAAFRKASMPPISNRPNSTSPTKYPMVLSPTPSEASTGTTSNMSYLPQPNSWSEMAEDDLIANLGPKERTRQEVLWEIVSSEERYVQDLIKFNETFCKSLLPPSANSPHLELYDPMPSLTRAMSPSSPPLSTNESFVSLPIAAKYSSTPRYSGERYPSDSSASTAPPMTPNEESISRGTLGPPPSSAARMNAYNILTNGRPAHKASFSSLNDKKRSHTSLPPPVSIRQGSGSSQSLHPESGTGRMSYHPGFTIQNKLQKASSRVSSGGSIDSTISSKHVKLSGDLEKVLTVLSGGILEGHIKLSAALKRRYENQYPLVRSLADVFTAHAYILREYSTYVLHLEKALSQVDNSLSLFNEAMSGTSTKSKRLSKKLEETDMGVLSKKLAQLEEFASEKGEAGLVISLSKPFQRLLKYPLLFQNLLFNTDPSLKEYEATLSMVDQVEEIVRSIEDQKSTEEEREKTRDVWARIDGLEKDKVIMAPKSSRLLISETQLSVPTNNPSKTTKEAPPSVKGKKSFKRLSDILRGDSDLWVVRFSDVSLLCEKNGITHLPIASFKKATKSDSVNDFGNKKYATMGRRSASVRARNLYRFVKVHEWHLKQKSGSTDALLSMNDVPSSRQRASEIPQSPPTSRYLPSIAGTPHATPTKVPLKTMDGSAHPSPSKSFRSRNNDGADDDTISVVSDGISEMSFAFKDGDQVKPNLKARARIRQSTSPSKTSAGGSRGSSVAVAKGRTASQPLSRRMSGGHVAGHAANAKFAHRLRSPDMEKTPSGNSGNSGNSDEHPHLLHPRPVSGQRGAGSVSIAAARRSLPPTSTTTMSGGLRPLHTANAATLPNRPAWNSGLSTTSTNASATASALASTSTARRASTPASQVGSVRGAGLRHANGGDSITTEGKRIPIGRSSLALASKANTVADTNMNTHPNAKTDTNALSVSEKGGENKEDASKGEDQEGLQNTERQKESSSEIRKSPSKEDSVVGLWRAFDESKGLNGFGDTPEKQRPASITGTESGSLPGSARGGVITPRTTTTRASTLATRGSVSSLRGGITSRSSNASSLPPRSIAPNSKSPVTGTAPSPRPGTAVPSPTGPSAPVRGKVSSVTSARVAGKAATVGRGGNLVSSRKRNLGGQI
ncbi:uncharacterized protein I303_102993 [Kwoniella dejecticola CBS 10117]|uniref:DH domain-containing protein n=1 Tax=Kwoniella dejecticola CBS 10117 TaxID=1296121 RepID=A0A1A6AAA7_9TREE|nr:uncharacterized protein I303_03013 [Kwoniella dejecticola CBS 10117]OBR86991.1 hypothetical protein I303_03013 [Kwoniella dejecticola CBS 10117]